MSPKKLVSGVFNLGGSCTVVRQHSLHMISATLLNSADRLYRNHLSRGAGGLYDTVLLSEALSGCTAKDTEYAEGSKKAFLCGLSVLWLPRSNTASLASGRDISFDGYVAGVLPRLGESHAEKVVYVGAECSFEAPGHRRRQRSLAMEKIGDRGRQGRGCEAARIRTGGPTGRRPVAHGTLPFMATDDSSARTIWLVVLGAALCGAMVWGGLVWETPHAGVTNTNQLPLTETRPTMHHPLVELLKLVCAALIGMLVSAVHRRNHGEKPLPKSLEQAQILLCVAGAMIMIIIGNSLARAFGVAGAAGIVRFRTPVEDPKDTTVIFLMLSLGLACGLGAFAVAGLGTVFLSLFLVVLGRVGETKQRTVQLSMTALSSDFPTEQVNRVLGGSVDFFEQREVVQGTETLIRYQVTLDPNASLTYLTQELMKAGLKAVSWGDPADKKKDKGV